MKINSKSWNMKRVMSKMVWMDTVKLYKNYNFRKQTFDKKSKHNVKAGKLS